MLHHLNRRFALALRKLFSKGLPQSLAVACSGGVDSMVLLDLLRDELGRNSSGGRSLIVIHLDHAQRSETETEVDHRTVSEYCHRHGLEFRFKHLGELIKPGASEAEMRAARYEALAELAEEGTVVFTAHHADDELETLLFKLLRGAHPDTLSGIAPRARRALAGGRKIRLARPLLTFAKAELEAHAEAHALDWHDDSTNQSARYARNRVRNELIPIFNALRPGSARRIHRFLAQLTVRKQNRRPPAARVKTIAGELSSSQGALVRDADFSSLRSALHQMMREDGGRTTQAHWESVKRQLELRLKNRRGGGPTKMIQFPGGHVLHFKGERLYWIKSTQKTP